MKAFLARVGLQGGAEVALVSRAEFLIARLARVLGGLVDLGLVRLEQVGADLLSKDTVVVLAEAELSDTRALKLTQRWCERLPGDLTVLCTAPTPGNLRVILHQPLVRTVFLGIGEEVLLREAVAGCLLNKATRACSSVIESRHSYPPILKRALLRAMTQEPPPLEDAVEHLSVGRTPYIRSLGAMAKALGCSPAYLSRLGKEAGLSVNDTIRWAVFLRGMAIRAYSGEHWSRIAPRLGFPDPAAWTHFVKRLVGMSPSKAATIALGTWEARLLSVLEGTSGPALPDRNRRGVLVS